MPERDLYVSLSKHESRVQPQMAKFKSELGPNPHEFKASSSGAHYTDLSGYLTRKRSVHQISPHCHCKQLISAVLSDCHCGSQMIKLSVFNRLLMVSTSNSAKRHCSRKKSSSDFEYPEVTSNMVGSSATPSKSPVSSQL